MSKVKLLTNLMKNKLRSTSIRKDVILYTNTNRINEIKLDTDLDFINEFINTTHMNKEILEAFKVTGYM